MELIDHINATGIGPSVYVRIPSPMCKLLGIVKGSALNIYKDGNKIVYEKKVE
jgi:antitoxin component of MazEF toxin-antitoxin module